MGRFLTETAVLEMIRQTEVHFKLITLDAAAAELEETDARLLNEGRARTVVDRSDPKTLLAYRVLSDINARPAYIIKIIMTRTILIKGLETLRFSMLSILAAGALLILLSLAALHGAVLGPLATLARHVRSIGESGDLGHRMTLDRADEIGSLARQFDAMLEKLADMRVELLDRSYHSGLASMTSDVLHQGRNILMPLSQSLDRIKILCKSLPAERITLALGELEQSSDDPERRARLYRFLSLSAGELLSTMASAEQLLDKASVQTHNMEYLFRDLEQYSRVGALASEVEPIALVRHALSHLPESVKKSCGFVMTPGLEGLGRFHGEQLVLTQVFASVLFHAATLAEPEPGGSRTVTADAWIDRESGTPMIHFVITAPGTVLDEDQRKMMFARDYQVSDRGSFCSNLHWCCNVVSAMNGTLGLTEDSRGFAFHLLIPKGGEA
jgi:HAMP domain-containing protein